MVGGTREIHKLCNQHVLLRARTAASGREKVTREGAILGDERVVCRRGIGGKLAELLRAFM